LFFWTLLALTGVLSGRVVVGFSALGDNVYQLIRPFVRFSALLLGVSVLSAAPVARTVPWNPADWNVPHDTFASRSITLKGTSSLQGQNIRATWDFGDGTQPVSFVVERGYDVSAPHTYFGIPGTVYEATLTVQDTNTGESSTSKSRIVLREKSLD